MDKKILEKIEKLLALGTSPNSAEAEAAITKAHALMLEHGIDSSEIGRDSDPDWATDISYEEFTRREAWKMVLLGAVAKWNFCVSGHTTKRLFICGSPAYRAVTKSMFCYLENACISAWKEHRAELIKALEGYPESRIKTKVREEKNDFLNGISRRLAIRIYELYELYEQDHPTCEDGEIVPQSVYSQAQQYISDVVGFAKARKSPKLKHSSGLYAGYEAGGSIGLNRQVSSSEAPHPQLPPQK